MYKLFPCLLVVGMLLVACTVSQPISSSPGASINSAEESRTSMSVDTRTVNVTSFPSATSSKPESAAQSSVPAAEPNKNIPDVKLDAEAYHDNSSRTLYEEGDYIYYMTGGNEEGKNTLYVCDKAGGTVWTITDDCMAFTVHDGKMYYTKPGDMEDYGVDCYNVLKSYDVATNTYKTLLRQTYNIVSIAYHDGRLYYSYELRMRSDFIVAGLFCCDLNGKNIQKIVDGPYTFSFYKDKIFFTEPWDPYGGAFKVYDKKTKEVKQLIRSEIKDWTFEIQGNLLYYPKTKESPKVLNVDTNVDHMIPGYEAALGQYAFYFGENSELMAYDSSSNETYTLLDLTGYDKEGTLKLYATADDAFLCTDQGAGAFRFYRILIKDGEASLQRVIDYMGDGY